MLGYAGVVNAEKLVGGSHHVDIEMFALGAFLVHKEEYGIVLRGILQDDGHDLEQSFPQGGRTALGNTAGERVEGAGLKGRSVNACEANESLLVRETGDIADFRDELRAENGTDAEEAHNDGIFGERSGKGIHFLGKRRYRFANSDQLRDCI